MSVLSLEIMHYSSFIWHSQNDMTEKERSGLQLVCNLNFVMEHGREIWERQNQQVMGLINMETLLISPSMCF